MIGKTRSQNTQISSSSAVSTLCRSKAQANLSVRIAIASSSGMIVLDLRRCRGRNGCCLRPARTSATSQQASAESCTAPAAAAYINHNLLSETFQKLTIDSLSIEPTMGRYNQARRQIACVRVLTEVAGASALGARHGLCSLCWGASIRIAD